MRLRKSNWIIYLRIELKRKNIWHQHPVPICYRDSCYMNMCLLVFLVLGSCPNFKMGWFNGLSWNLLNIMNWKGFEKQTHIKPPKPVMVTKKACAIQYFLEAYLNDSCEVTCFTVHGDITIYIYILFMVQKCGWKNNSQPWMKMHLLLKVGWCCHFAMIFYWRVNQDHFWEFPIEECHISHLGCWMKHQSTDRFSHISRLKVFSFDMFLVAKNWGKQSSVELYRSYFTKLQNSWNVIFEFLDTKNHGSWLAIFPVMVVEFHQRWNFLDVPGRKWMDQWLRYLKMGYIGEN